MIITTKKPYSQEETQKLKEQFEVYIKKAANQFLQQAQRWIKELKNKKVKKYIKKILLDLDKQEGHQQLDIKQAEKYLMYSILLHFKFTKFFCS